MRKHEASALFRTLCACPPASPLDRDAGMSVRDFEWLHNVSKHLPQVLPVPPRVQPGMAPVSSPSLGSSGDFYEAPDSMLDSDEDTVSTIGTSVFEKLYQNGLESKERKERMALASTAENESRAPADPHRFERLYQEAQLKREEQEKRTEDFYRGQFPQQGPKQLSDEVWQRLVKPKEKTAGVHEAVDEAVIRPERSTCWDAIPIVQIRAACEQEGLDCKGKTK